MNKELYELCPDDCPYKSDCGVDGVSVRCSYYKGDMMEEETEEKERISLGVVGELCKPLGMPRSRWKRIRKKERIRRHIEECFQ